MRFSGIQKLTLLDFPDHTACILFTPGCNFRCGFCHNPEFVLPEKIREIAPSFIEEAPVLNFLRARQGFLEGVVISGGEPTIWPALPQFIRVVKQLGFLVKLDTNGNNPTMLESLLKEELLDYVALDVKMTLSGYAKLVGKGALEKNIQKSINLLKRGKVPYEFRTTLIREIHTPTVLQEMRSLMRGAARLYLQTFRPEVTLHPKFRTYHPFSGEETQKLVDFFQAVIPEVSIRT